MALSDATFFGNSMPTAYCICDFLDDFIATANAHFLTNSLKILTGKVVLFSV